MNLKTPLFLYIILAVVTAANPSASSAGQKPTDGVANIKILDLETAKRIAAAGNPSQLAVKERIEQARQRVRQKQATWFPSLDAATSRTRKASAANATPADDGDAYETTLTATLTLFDGFNRTYNLKSARYGELASEEAEMDARRLLICNVAQSYYALQNAAENIAIAQSDRDYNATQLKDADARREMGAGPLSDVLNFRIKVNTASSTLMEAEKTYAIALTGLAALMGVDETTFPEDFTLAPLETTGAWETAPLVTEALVRTALALRPDLFRVEYTLKQAESAVGIARSGYYPTVALTGGISGSREGDASYERDDFGSSFGVTMRMNLFAGGTTRATVAEAEASRREALYTLEDRKLTVRKEVRDAVKEMNTAIRQVALREETAALTRQSRDLVEEEYRAGKTSVVKLNAAQNELVSARGNLVEARVSLLTAWEKIRSVTGTNLNG